MAEQISGIPAEMQACQIVEFNKPPEIRTIPTPKEMQPHEMLIKVAAASICHTDLEYMKGNFPIKLPITGSHEGTGTVAAVGSNVKNFQPGDRVMVGMVFDRCGNCEICNGPEKFRLYCEKKDPLMSMMSVGRDGPWQEYLVVDGREAALLPDRMSFATAAPLACAGVVAWRGVVLADLKAGQWIGIVGSGGGLGHLAIQLAKAQGLKVFAVDAREPGIELSKQCGADLVLDARDGEEAIEKAAKETTASGGVAATLNLSDAPTALPIACAITKVSGTVVQIAVVSLPTPIPDAVVFRKSC